MTTKSRPFTGWERKISEYADDSFPPGFNLHAFDQIVVNLWDASLANPFSLWIEAVHIWFHHLVFGANPSSPSSSSFLFSISLFLACSRSISLLLHGKRVSLYDASMSVSLWRSMTRPLLSFRPLMSPSKFQSHEPLFEIRPHVLLEQEGPR